LKVGKGALARDEAVEQGKAMGNVVLTMK